jgi:hypothetical protein
MTRWSQHNVVELDGYFRGRNAVCQMDLFYSLCILDNLNYALPPFDPFFRVVLVVFAFIWTYIAAQ